MQREVVIDGLTIGDQKHLEKHGGPYVFNDQNSDMPADVGRPFPCQMPQKVTIRRVTTRSGLSTRTSPNTAIRARGKVEQGE
jgi:hypothetical protein